MKMTALLCHLDGTQELVEYELPDAPQTDAQTAPQTADAQTAPAAAAAAAAGQTEKAE